MTHLPSVCDSMTLNDLKLRLSTMMALSRIDHFPLVFMLERMKWIVQAAMYTIAQRQPVQSGRLHMQEKEFFHLGECYAQKQL